MNLTHVKTAIFTEKKDAYYQQKDINASNVLIGKITNLYIIKKYERGNNNNSNRNSIMHNVSNINGREKENETI